MYDDDDEPEGPKSSFTTYLSEGNVHFNQGEYKKALDSYTQVNIYSSFWSTKWAWAYISWVCLHLLVYKSVVSLVLYTRVPNVLSRKKRRILSVFKVIWSELFQKKDLSYSSDSLEKRLNNQSLMPTAKLLTSPKLNECFFNQIETHRNCFLFLLEIPQQRICKLLSCGL